MKKKESLEDILAKIHETMLENMLDDLNKPEKRTPQLYQAVIKELDRNGIDCLLKAGDENENALGKLLKATKESYEEDYGRALN